MEALKKYEKIFNQDQTFPVTTNKKSTLVIILHRSNPVKLVGVVGVE